MYKTAGKVVFILLACVFLSVSVCVTQSVADPSAQGKANSKDSKTMKEYEAVRQTMGLYIEAGLKGKSEIMKKAFHPQAIMYGHKDGKLVGGPIQTLFDNVDKNPPSTNLKAEIIVIDVVEKIAHVRVESENWGGSRYSDMFLLVKDGDDWKILTKVYHRHE